MRYLLTATLATAASFLIVPPAVRAQGGPSTKLTPASICGLLTRAQVEKEIGRKLQIDPEGMPLAFGGALCEYDGDKAQVIFFPGPNAESKWEGMMKEFKRDVSKRHPAPELGTAAFVVYPPTRFQYERPVAMAVMKTGSNVLIVSSSVDSKKKPEDALAPTLALAKLVMSKLR